MWCKRGSWTHAIWTARLRRWVFFISQWMLIYGLKINLLHNKVRFGSNHFLSFLTSSFTILLTLLFRYSLSSIILRFWWCIITILAPNCSTCIRLRSSHWRYRGDSQRSHAFSRSCYLRIHLWRSFKCRGGFCSLILRTKFNFSWVNHFFDCKLLRFFVFGLLSFASILLLILSF